MAPCSLNGRFTIQYLQINEVSQCNIDIDETATKGGNSFHMTWVGYIPFRRLQPFPQWDSQYHQWKLKIFFLAVRGPLENCIFPPWLYCQFEFRTSNSVIPFGQSLSSNNIYKYIVIVIKYIYFCHFISDKSLITYCLERTIGMVKKVIKYHKDHSLCIVMII